jgi:predicted transcriptional regulator
MLDKIHVSEEEMAGERLLCEYVMSLEKILNEKHMTKYAFAKKAGLKPQVVSQVFNGDNAELSTLVKMAQGAGKKLVLKLA